MKILVTGAHFTPAVAVIEEVKKMEPKVDIVYVGRQTTLEGDNTQSVESRVLPKLGVKFISLQAGKLQRFISIDSIVALLKIPIGFIQAFFILLKEKPDVVLSFGGYVGLPVVFCCWLLSIPIIIHEQSLQMGLANKISSFLADKIAISFKDTKVLPGKITAVTGNPTRLEILYPEKLTQEYHKLFSNAKKEKKPVIFITGGNQGSHIINLAVEKCLEGLNNISYVIHQTGESQFQDFERLSALQSKHYLVKKWLGREIGQVFSKASLVVSRAGINTLMELIYFRKPVIVIPIPFQDEQNQNARYFENLGLVKILPQSKLSGKTLLQSVKQMLNDLNYFNKPYEKVGEINNNDAAKRLALETILLATNT